MHKLVTLSLSLLSLTACVGRPTVGEPYYCRCAVPLLGRGGCLGIGIAFDNYTCVAPTDTPVNACNNACMNIAGIGSSVFLECTGGYPGFDEPAVWPDARFAPSCTPYPGSSTGPLVMGTTGYESSPWDYMAARSTVTVSNARDSRVVPLDLGRISLSMPEGHSNPGPMRFDLLQLVRESPFTFDGHSLSKFRLMSAGRFGAEANMSFVSPPRPGQFNAYRIDTGYPLAYSVVIDGNEVSDTISDSSTHVGYMYSATDASGVTSQYLVYDGVFTIGTDPKNPVRLTMHLEFRYGGVTGTRPPPPELDIARTDSGSTVTITAKTTPAASPSTHYEFIWVAGKDLTSNAPKLGASQTLVVDRKLVKDDWVTVLVHAKEARVFREARVCLEPKGCN